MERHDVTYLLGLSAKMLAVVLIVLVLFLQTDSVISVRPIEYLPTGDRSATIQLILMESIRLV